MKTLKAKLVKEGFKVEAKAKFKYKTTPSHLQEINESRKESVEWAIESLLKDVGITSFELVWKEQDEGSYSLTIYHNKSISAAKEGYFKGYLNGLERANFFTP